MPDPDPLEQFLHNTRATSVQVHSYIIPDAGIITVTTEFEPFVEEGED